MTAAASGVLVVAADTARVLLCRRVDSGLWSTPGGMMEAGEYPDEAARRELAEETGYEGALRLRFLGTVPATIRYHLWLGDVPREFEPVLNSEHDLARWALLLEPPAPLHPGLGWALANLLPELGA